jgi:hypothetical protein
VAIEVDTEATDEEVEVTAVDEEGRVEALITALRCILSNAPARTRWVDVPWFVVVDEFVVTVLVKLCALQGLVRVGFPCRGPKKRKKKKTGKKKPEGKTPWLGKGVTLK